MNENINLCEILKDCPRGTKFFSFLHGKVEFLSIDSRLSHSVIVEARTRSGIKQVKTYSKEGYYDNNYDGYCVLVPSLEQPDWSKWQCSKPKFDPKTLQPFDKVLGRHKQSKVWFSDFYSFHRIGIFATIGNGYYDVLIPYNEETKHLAGTTEEAPEHYRYWED